VEARARARGIPLVTGGGKKRTLDQLCSELRGSGGTTPSRPPKSSPRRSAHGAHGGGGAELGEAVELLNAALALVTTPNRIPHDADLRHVVATAAALGAAARKGELSDVGGHAHALRQAVAALRAGSAAKATAALAHLTPLPPDASQPHGPSPKTRHANAPPIGKRSWRKWLSDRAASSVVWAGCVFVVLFYASIIANHFLFKFYIDIFAVDCFQQLAPWLTRDFLMQRLPIGRLRAIMEGQTGTVDMYLYRHGLDEGIFSDTRAFRLTKEDLMVPMPDAAKNALKSAEWYAWFFDVLASADPWRKHRKLPTVWNKVALLLGVVTAALGPGVSTAVRHAMFASVATGAGIMAARARAWMRRAPAAVAPPPP
jgi:hypothetical protein